MKPSRGRLDEPRAVRLLARVLGTAGGAVEVGIGDDAAVLRIGRARLVWTLDACIEGVHFRRAWLDLEALGYKSLAAAARDLAAMGAVPLGALVGLVWPRAPRASDLSAIARGQAAAARELGCPVVGGNLARGPCIELTTSVIGRVERPLLRSGARPGDELWLVGELGLAAAGVRLLGTRAARRRCPARALGRCLAAWRRPRALVAEGRGLRGRAHAAIDTSDGLAIDAGRLASASQVGVIVEGPSFERVLRAELLAAARALRQDALVLALSGGEDYALLATGPRRARPAFARCIGRIVAGHGAWLEQGGRRLPLGGGWDHFRE